MIRIFLIALLLALSATANANTPIVPVFACLLPLWTSILTMGLAFIIISALEGTAMHYLAKLSWRRSMLVSFLANLASTLIGAIWYQEKATLIWMFLSAPAILAAWRLRWYSVILGTLAFWVLIPSLGLRSVVYSRIYWFLLPAFLLTFAVEGPFWLRMMPLKKALVTTLAVNLISYSLLLSFLLGMGIRAEDDPGLSIMHYSYSARFAAQAGDAKHCLEILEDAHRVALRPQFGRWFQNSRPSREKLKWAGRWGEAADWAIGPFIEAEKYEDALMVLRNVQKFKGLNDMDKKDLAKAIEKHEEELKAASTKY